MDRRGFLKWTGVLSASTMMPQFLSGQKAAIQQAASTGKKLVIIQWSGGNDGLNTVIPYRNDIYYRERPIIGIRRLDALALTDEFGVHPELKTLKSLYDNGDLGVIQSVGYPNPNRSHFRSLEIWQTASSGKHYLDSGWIGRMMDQQCKGCAHPYDAIEFGNELNPALKGEKQSGLAMTDPEKLHRMMDHPMLKSVARQDHHLDHEENQVDYLHKTLREATSSIDYVYEKSKAFTSQLVYPATKLGAQLRSIAQLICSGSETKVYYVSMTGFDTHANQLGVQARIFKQYSEALQVFVKDLQDNNQWDDTLVMTFSEFGRRVKQNAARGTDHGKANVLFLAGGGLAKKGVSNTHPDLADLDDGDLKFKVDFRSVYGSILRDHFHMDTSGIISSDAPRQQWL